MLREHILISAPKKCHRDMPKNPMPAAFIYDPKHWIAKAVYRNAWLITIQHATSFFDANRQATHP